MTIRSLRSAVVICSLAIAGCVMAPGLAHAQDDEYSIDDFKADLENYEDDGTFDDFLAEIEKDKKDKKRCRGSADVSPAEQREACTRLIEKAPRENDVVGEYYVDRAMARETRAGQCQDVRKGIAIIEASNSTIYGKKFLDAARSLEDAACE